MRVSTVLAIAAVSGATSTGFAARVDLLIFENAGGVSPGTVDLWVDVVDSGAFIDFVFHNDSTDGVVTAIYIEANGFLSGGTVLGGAGTSFSPPAAPGSPPGSISSFGGAWAGNLYSVDADPPPSDNGVNVGETLTLRFTLLSSYSQVLDALQPNAVDRFRIAQHAQSFGENSLWTTNAPAPGALALLGLGVVAAHRRR